MVENIARETVAAREGRRIPRPVKCEAGIHSSACMLLVVFFFAKASWQHKWQGMCPWKGSAPHPPIHNSLPPRRLPLRTEPSSTFKSTRPRARTQSTCFPLFLLLGTLRSWSSWIRSLWSTTTLRSRVLTGSPSANPSLLCDFPPLVVLCYPSQFPMLGLLLSKSSQESGANDNDNVLPKHVCLWAKCSSQHSSRTT
jgi:hypothetical protein